MKQLLDLLDRAGAIEGRTESLKKAKFPGVLNKAWLAFDAAQFDVLIPWLESHRRGLNILVHGDTGNALEDHTAHASWLGAPAELNLAVFRS